MNYPSYTPSNSFNISGFLITAVVALALACILGYVYSILIIFVPFIYLNALITAGFGIALGWALKILNKLTHNRNHKSQIILAVITGLAANFFQWTAYILYAVMAEVPSIGAYLQGLSLIAAPQDFFAIIMEINQVGMWELFGFPFTGIFLGIVWLIEFLMILCIPIFIIWSAKQFPYSETLGTWYKKYTLNDNFRAVASVAGMIEKLNDNVVQAIETLGPGDARRFSKIHVYFLEGESSQYLDIEKILVTDQSEGKTESSLVVENYKISRTDAKDLLNKFSNENIKMAVD